MFAGMGKGLASITSTAKRVGREKNGNLDPATKEGGLRSCKARLWNQGKVPPALHRGESRGERCCSQEKHWVRS